MLQIYLWLDILYFLLLNSDILYEGNFRGVTVKQVHSRKLQIQIIYEVFCQSWKAGQRFAFWCLLRSCKFSDELPHDLIELFSFYSHFVHTLVYKQWNWWCHHHPLQEEGLSYLLLNDQLWEIAGPSCM